jgi:hypothetical protein
MTDLKTIRLIPFCGKVDEWPIWSEKFLAKAKRYGFKDLLLGKLSIPKLYDVFDEMKVIELNETAFNIVKGCKTKDYPDGNAASAWEKLKNKYEPVSANSMVKLDKQFRELTIKKRPRP